jgi:hypothetical protein
MAALDATSSSTCACLAPSVHAQHNAGQWQAVNMLARSVAVFA